MLASTSDTSLCGISRVFVLGFSASNLASTILLNPIAAVRAKNIASRIHPTRSHSNPVCSFANSAPVKANGSAKTVWLKRISDAYFCKRENITVTKTLALDRLAIQRRCLQAIEWMWNRFHSTNIPPHRKSPLEAQPL